MKCIINASVIKLKGVSDTAVAILFNNSSGKSSGLNVPTVTYKPGRKIATKKDKYFNHLVNVAKYGLFS